MNSGRGVHAGDDSARHSVAILTRSRDEIDDVCVRELADGIIGARKREIEDMNWLIDDISENGKATTQAEAEARPVPEFTADQQALPWRQSLRRRGRLGRGRAVAGVGRWRRR